MIYLFCIRIVTNITLVCINFGSIVDIATMGKYYICSVLPKSCNYFAKHQFIVCFSQNNREKNIFNNPVSFLLLQYSHQSPNSASKASKRDIFLMSNSNQLT